MFISTKSVRKRINIVQELVEQKCAFKKRILKNLKNVRRSSYKFIL